MEVTLKATPWKGSAPSEPLDAWILLVRGAVVGGHELLFEYHGFGEPLPNPCSIEWEPGGFLTATFRGVAEESYHAFMSSRSIDDVLEGTGERITDGDEIVGLAWMPGSELRVPVTQLNVEFVGP